MRNLYEPNNYGNLCIYTRTFLGECFGIGIKPRGAGDPHVLLTFLVEDDGYWGEHPASFSCAWLQDIRDQVDAAMRWIETNCEKDPSGYGWVFRGK